MTARTAHLIVSALCLGLISTPASALTIGGDPANEMIERFSDPQGGAVSVYSFAFDAPGTEPPGSGIALAAGETLSAYVLHNESGPARRIAAYSVAVPGSAALTLVGSYDSEVDRLRGSDETAPASWERTADGVEFRFQAPGLAPWGASEVMYFVTASPFSATQAPATISYGTEASDPVPEPSAMLAAGLALIAIRRRRRAA
ncbi:MAG: PEP-CTERM sorting domain-containing protein [Planctomycetota bacterium]